VTGLGHHLPPLILLLGWVKFDARAPSNHKLVKLSDAAFRMWWRMCCWSSEQRTGGVIEESVDLRTWTDSRTPRKVFAEIEAAGLLDSDEDGYRLHDFEAYNPPDERTREQARKRKARQRERERRAAEQAPTAGGVTRDIDPAESVTVTRDTGRDLAGAGGARATTESDTEKSERTRRARRRAPANAVRSFGFQ
jgi:hypothetical protein